MHCIPHSIICNITKRNTPTLTGAKFHTLYSHWLLQNPTAVKREMFKAPGKPSTGFPHFKGAYKKEGERPFVKVVTEHE